jgi:hypothetical protein
MTITNIIKNACAKLGNNNKSIYPMIAIATANGICRPTFTMMKKGENPESKKYAALREMLTEVIAVPTYWVCGELMAKCGKYITSVATDKKIAKMEQEGQVLSDTVKQTMKNSAVKKGQAGLMLIGVCVAAGLVIPALCSVAVKPVMNKISPKKDNKGGLDIKENAITPPTVLVQPQQQIVRPTFKNLTQSGMKVGGV